jgi:DNA polymerase-3 subunit chi
LTAPRVDFYVQPGAGPEGLARLACRLVEKAWSSGHAVCLYDPDRRALAALDTLLWTFAEGSFIPHEIVEDAAGSCEAPVALVSSPPGPSLPRAILLNRDVTVPDFAMQFERVIELVDDEPTRRQRARDRFRAWRRLGVEPHTHNLAALRDAEP